MSICRAVIIMCTVFFMSISHVQAKHSDEYYRNFWNPTYLAKRLSYCSFDGKQCGMDIATAYCQKMGYKKSNKATIAYNVGLTNYLNTYGQCKGWQCNGFKLIQCVGNLTSKLPHIYSYRYRRFEFPRLDHYRIDWCYQNGKRCGQRAAYSFCRRLGYLKATSYTRQGHVAATKALGNQKLCFGKSCAGFSQITCYR